VSAEEAEAHTDEGPSIEQPMGRQMTNDGSQKKMTRKKVVAVVVGEDRTRQSMACVETLDRERGARSSC
jgi:hypothetical protein